MTTENRSLVPGQRRIEAILDSMPPSDLAAFVEDIPNNQITRYLMVMFSQFVDSTHTYVRGSSPRHLAILNYIIDGTALPESFTERQKLQLAALKRVFERANADAREVLTSFRARELAYRQQQAQSSTHTGGKRHSRKRSIRQRRKSIRHK